MRKLKKHRKQQYEWHPALITAKRWLHYAWRVAKHFLPWPPRTKTGKRILIGFVGFVVLIILGMYGIARWYIWSVDDQPQVVGASFIPDYAASLGLDPKQTLHAMLDDLPIKHIRLTSYWSDMEPQPGVFDFSQLDWEMAMAEKSGAKVTLSVGLRQPRWPECHEPDWAYSDEEWQADLTSFIKQIVNRYKTSPALESYQVENEYFLQGFGTCTDFDRDRLVAETKLVRKLDPLHPVVINRSNNSLGVAIGAPTPDTYGISIYKRVWSTAIHRYLEYPQPAWYYAFVAGVQKLWNGRETIAHEIQAEAWPPHGQPIIETSLAEQNKSMDAGRLASRFQYARDTGLRQVYMWGAEYWYYRDVKLHDPSLWNVAKTEFTAR